MTVLRVSLMRLLTCQCTPSVLWSYYCHRCHCNSTLSSLYSTLSRNFVIAIMPSISAALHLFILGPCTMSLICGCICLYHSTCFAYYVVSIMSLWLQKALEVVRVLLLSGFVRTLKNCLARVQLMHLSSSG